MRRSLLAVVLLALVLAACGGDDPDADAGQQAARPAAGEPTVVLRDTQFQPADTTVEAGSAVAWVWDDGSTAHNVVGDGFQSEIKTDGTFTHTFAEPGAYPYVCALHPGMEGTVTVVARS